MCLAADSRGRSTSSNPKCQRIAGQAASTPSTSCQRHQTSRSSPPPPDTVPGLIAALGKKGTRAAVVITGGLGLELRQRMLDAARPTCLRIVCPNCLGLWVPALRVNPNFRHGEAEAAQLAFLSQSGALVGGVLDWAEFARYPLLLCRVHGRHGRRRCRRPARFPRRRHLNERDPALSRDDPVGAQIHVGEPLGGARQAGGGDQVRTERSLGESGGDRYRRACRKRRSGGQCLPPRGTGARRGTRLTAEDIRFRLPRPAQGNLAQDQRPLYANRLWPRHGLRHFPRGSKRVARRGAACGGPRLL